jgi:hypothetical protein
MTSSLELEAKKNVASKGQASRRSRSSTPNTRGRYNEWLRRPAAPMRAHASCRERPFRIHLAPTYGRSFFRSNGVTEW